MKRLGVKAKVMIGGAAYLGMKGLGTYQIRGLLK